MITENVETVQHLGLIPYVLAFFLGSVVSLAELLSRYTDGPGRIFKFKESYLYLVFNGIVSLVAYFIVREYDISFGQIGKSPYSQAVIAGLFSMAILRSSVASIKFGQSTFQAGFAPMLQIFLDTTDRAFDRRRSQQDSEDIEIIMKDVDFMKAVKDLPTTCLNLMQNVNETETKMMGGEVNELETADLSSQKTKSLNLGIIIARVTGVDLLRVAVKSLGADIKSSKTDISTGKSTFQSAQKEQLRNLKKKFL